MFRRPFARDKNPNNDGDSSNAYAAYSTLATDEIEESEQFYARNDEGGGSSRGENVSFDASPNERDGDEGEDDDVLRPGDHVFVEVGLSQRHGIVVEVLPRDEPAEATANDPFDGFLVARPEEENDEDRIMVLSFFDDAVAKEQSKGNVFTNLWRRKDSAPRTLQEEEENSASQQPLTNGFDDANTDVLGNVTTTPTVAVARTSNVRKQTLRMFKRSSRSKKVRKVRYGVSRAKRILSRLGSATSVPTDERGLVLARATALLESSNDDDAWPWPDYDSFSANDECVAVWCRTGRWLTLQAASMLEIVSATQAGAAIVAASAVSQMSVTYTAPYWIPGYVVVWSVPATVAYPILVPLLVGYGMTSLVPLEILRRNRNKWRVVSESFNRAFWSRASDQVRMDYFAGSVSGKEDDLKHFFGFYDKPKEDDGDDADDQRGGGRYMPLNINGGAGGDDDEDEGDVTTRTGSRERAVATSDQNATASSFGREGEDIKDKFGGFMRNLSERFVKPSTETGNTNEENADGFMHKLSERFVRSSEEEKKAYENSGIDASDHAGRTKENADGFMHNFGKRFMNRSNDEEKKSNQSEEDITITENTNSMLTMMFKPPM